MLVDEEVPLSAWKDERNRGVLPKVGGRISSRRSKAKKTMRTRSFWRLSGKVRNLITKLFAYKLNSVY